MAKGSRSYRLFLEDDFLLALPALYTVHCTVMGSWSTYICMLLVCGFANLIQQQPDIVWAEGEGLVEDLHSAVGVVGQVEEQHHLYTPPPTA